MAEVSMVICSRVCIKENGVNETKVLSELASFFLSRCLVLSTFRVQVRDQKMSYFNMLFFSLGVFGYLSS